MAGAAEGVGVVELHGTKISTFAHIAQYALKLKGVPYHYIEEDLANKSQALVEKLNPVYKKVPVLVVDGKPIPESLIILEYIDEMWKDRRPLLLPHDDAYLKARVRFWADFFYKKMVPASYAIRNGAPEDQERAAKELMDSLIVLDEGIRNDMPSSAGNPFIHGAQPGMLDIIIGACSSVVQAFEELAGVRLVTKEKTPVLWSCTRAFSELEITKGVMLPAQELVQYMKK